MKSKIKNRYIFISLGILTFVLYILQSTAGVFPVILNGSCIVLLPVVIFSGMLFNRYTGTFIGLLAGMLMDINTNGFISFNAITLMLIGSAAWLLVNCYFNKNFSTSVIISILFTTLYFLIKWLIKLAFNYSEGVVNQFVIYYIPSVIYTVLVGIPVYFLLKFMLNKIENKQ